LSALPYADSSCHGEETLDEGAEEEPEAGFDTHVITDAAYEGTHVEGDERGESLLVC